MGEGTAPSRVAERPASAEWQIALLAHLQRLTDAVERVEGRLEGLEVALVKRGSL